MQQVMQEITVETNGQHIHDITAQVEAFVSETAITTGILNLSILHTSASLLIQENISPDVKADLLAFFDKLAPMDADYAHSSEGKDDMPAHLKTALTNTNLTISVLNHSLVLGKWQAIFLFEHRFAPRQRVVLAHLLGE